jgi:serine/threonine-protein kinase RsbW
MRPRLMLPTIGGDGEYGVRQVRLRARSLGAVDSSVRRGGYGQTISTQRWTFAAVPESVAEARRAARAVAERHRAGEDLTASMLVCVSEAVTNVVLHAYRDREGGGEVELEADKPDGYLCVYVRDRGGGLRPRPDSPGAGYGLSLITQLASELTVHTGGSGGVGTELVMRFDLPG